MSPSPIDNASWYRQNYPHQETVHKADPRCWDVLGVLGPAYNVIDHDLPGGGFHRWGTGIGLYTRSCVSTFDNDTLTRLTVAAHRHLCRVEVGPARLWGRDRWSEGCDAEGRRPSMLVVGRDPNPDDPEDWTFDPEDWLGWAELDDNAIRDGEPGWRPCIGYIHISVQPRLARVDSEDQFDYHPGTEDLAQLAGTPRPLGGPLEMRVDSQAVWTAMRPAAVERLAGTAHGLSWIACDPGLLADPTTITVGTGLPGIDGPLLRLTIVAPADTVAHIYKDLTALVKPSREVFDKTGVGMAVWELINRPERPALRFPIT